LQPYQGPATRYRCPSCKKKGEFARYKDSQTGELLPQDVGRCNREDSCGYHLTPAQYLERIQPTGGEPTNYKPPQIKSLMLPPRAIDRLPSELVNESMAGYDRNNFVIFLKSLYGESVTQDLIAQYYIGTSKHWPGATVFWQIDNRGRARQVKIMLYNPDTGRRVKDEGSRVFFAGKSLVKNYNANLVQCLFGEHLLAKRPGDQVAIVESEKTAIIASVYFPQLIWLATGGKHGARWTDPTVCSSLRNRDIILFPDLGAYDAWKEKGDNLRRVINCRLSVSNLLEKSASDRQRAEGWDMADYLVRKDEAANWAITDEGYPMMWDCVQQIHKTNIRSTDIIALPSDVITGKEFRHTNIVTVRTGDGGDYDILFDECGEPEADADLVEKVGAYFGKKFEAIIFDGKKGYAMVYRKPEKAGRTQASHHAET
jgi:hypothetical protein